jgi:hypothetical protein
MREAHGTTRRRAKAALMACALAAALGAVAPVPALAQTSAAHDLQMEGPRTLVIHYRADPDKRAAFRTFMTGPHAALLRKLKQERKIEGFRTFFSWYAQPTVWDAMVELRFSDFAAVAEWNRIERTAPGGLSADGLELGRPVQTMLADSTWAGGRNDADPAAENSVYYVIPYTYQNAAEYREYVAGYGVPQYEGWLKAGLLSGYEVLMNRHPVGDPDPWDALLILRYRDLDSFGKRQHILDEVRKGLRQQPAWLAWHERKGKIRSEAENSIADLVAN